NMLNDGPPIAHGSVMRRATVFLLPALIGVCASPRVSAARIGERVTQILQRYGGATFGQRRSERKSERDLGKAVARALRELGGLERARYRANSPARPPGPVEAVIAALPASSSDGARRLLLRPRSRETRFWIGSEIIAQSYYSAYGKWGGPNLLAGSDFLFPR